MQIVETSPGSRRVCGLVGTTGGTIIGGKPLRQGFHNRFLVETASERYMKALEGITIIDTTQAVIGPFATQTFADLGAEVIKVEQPGTGDLTRSLSPSYGPYSAYYASLNRNKRSVEIDLSSPEGQAVLHEMLGDADVFIQNWGPGVADNLNLDYDTVSSLNDQIVYTNLSGYGDDSPYQGQKLFDIVAQAQSGIMGITGTADGDPVRVGVSIADIAGAFTAMYSVTTALFHRERTGEGEYIDISLLDSAFQLLLYHLTNYDASGEIPERLGSKHPNLTPYQAFETADSSVVVGVINDRLWPPFCKVIDHEEWIEDHQFATMEGRHEHRAALDEALEPIFRERSAEEWLDALRAVGVPAEKVNTVAEIAEDPHIEARDMFPAVDHPDVDEMKLPGLPPQFDTMDVAEPSRPPELGEDTAAVLAEYGYSEAELESMRAEDIIP